MQTDPGVGLLINQQPPVSLMVLKGLCHGHSKKEGIPQLPVGGLGGERVYDVRVRMTAFHWHYTSWGVWGRRGREVFAIKFIPPGR